MHELSEKELGVITVVVEEFERHRLPALLRLKEKVNNGIALIDAEYDYLTRSISEMNHYMPQTVGHPELEEFVTHVLHLYTEICELALNLERGLVSQS